MLALKIRAKTKIAQLLLFFLRFKLTAFLQNDLLWMSIQVKSFNRAQGNPYFCQFHAYQPMTLPYLGHVTDNKLYETNFRVPLRNQNGHSSNKGTELLLPRVDSAGLTPYFHFAFLQYLIRDQHYIKFHPSENRPVFKYHLGTQQTRYSFENFTRCLSFQIFD